MDSTIRETKVSEVAHKLREGMYVETNGSVEALSPIPIKGMIGEITEKSFYIWQNERDGNRSIKDPSTKGYKFSWQVSKDNKNAWIKIKSGSLDWKGLFNKLR